MGHVRKSSSSPRSESSRLPSREARCRHRSVKDEIRQNLIAKLRAGESALPRHHRLRRHRHPADRQRHPRRATTSSCSACAARQRHDLLRALTTLLDEAIPVVPGSEINDDPLAPLSAYGRQKVAAEGDAMRIDWLPRDARYVEKLATPDVTIADMIGDIDPIKAAHGGLQLASELAMHFGLLPRANRGMFAINELPDLAGKIQVGLFNILQEGDVQIKGFPVRLPLDVMVALHRQSRGLHRARQDHHAAQGSHRRRDPHALHGEPRSGDGDHRAGSVDRARSPDRSPALRPRGRRGDRVPGAQRAQDRQALGRQPAHAHQRPRKRRLERRAARASSTTNRPSSRAPPTSIPRCRP